MTHILIFSSALLLAPFVTLSAAEKDKPNVIVILTDQQHAGMLSCAGNRWLKTPADILARHRQYLREGVETNHDKLAEGYLIK